MKKAVLFDLDGTLLDTAPDLAFAINQVLAAENRRPVIFDHFRAHVYAGSQSMVEFAFNTTLDDPSFEKRKQIFLDAYFKCCTTHTTFFPTIPTLLNTLDEKHVPWGIVTNKPQALTNPIVKHFSLDQRASVIICGDTLSQRKPEPDTLLHACEIMQVDPKHTIYVGDTEIDVIAAHAANMPCIAVGYGYYPIHSHPSTWQADYLAHTPEDILTGIQVAETLLRASQPNTKAAVNA